MSEINETEDKTVRGGRKMTLNVRRTVESGHVRQSFSHGRSCLLYTSDAADD